jgi:TatA/E family protein of Tat protein translocase
MFSFPDLAIVGGLALLLFGPDRLPGMMRQAGKFMREVQSTSQSFVAEMERAADIQDRAASAGATPAVAPLPRDDEPPLPDEDFGKNRPAMPPEAFESPPPARAEGSDRNDEG